MKKPWEIYFDEFWLEFNRKAARGVDGQRHLTADELAGILNKVSLVTAQFLVDSGWRQNDALELVRRFPEAMSQAAKREDQADSDAKTTFRAALRDAYTDYELAKQGRVTPRKA